MTNTVIEKTNNCKGYPIKEIIKEDGIIISSKRFHYEYCENDVYIQLCVDIKDDDKSYYAKYQKETLLFKKYVNGDCEQYTYNEFDKVTHSKITINGEITETINTYDTYGVILSEMIFKNGIIVSNKNHNEI